MSFELPDRLSNYRLSKPNDAAVVSSLAMHSESTVNQTIKASSILGLSFSHMPIVSSRTIPDSLFHTFRYQVAFPGVIHAPYHYAKLADPSKFNEKLISSVPASRTDALYCWHLPHPRACGHLRGNKCSKAKSQTVVVLLGWLGAKQKHMKRYADWYTSRGFHAVTFTYPMSDVLSIGGRAEQDAILLASHLADWVSEENEKNLVFHTFSNTGWLTYGVLLEKFRKQDPSLMGKIKGCIVDSAPVATPDPQVWASGFSAAFMKKQSIATKGISGSNNLESNVIVDAESNTIGVRPAATETALLVILEMFFKVVLNLPTVNRRLSDVLNVLDLEQPKCPQLYIYSSSDRVIPAKSVVSFVERQRRAGHQVNACDFLSSPHVDHYRNHPELYSSLLTDFFHDSVLTCCKDSS